MPIYHSVIQRSREWFLMRLGIPTASEFSRIVTPTGKLSKQAEGYANELLAEMMLGRLLDNDYQSQYMIRGQELEDSAYSSFEFETGQETMPGGFVTNDAKTYGCSPDRLIGEHSGLELKCPSPPIHMGYLLNPETMRTDKGPQVQGCLLVTGRSYWNLASHHPELPDVILKVERDEPYIKTLSDSLDAFCETLAKARKLLEDKYGPFPEPTAANASDDPGALGVSDIDVDEMIAQGLVIPQ